MIRICRIIRAPGTRRAIESAAPTQVAREISQDGEQKDMITLADNIDIYPDINKSMILDRCLDEVVKVSAQSSPSSLSSLPS